ncbi:thioredoxin family protein [Roseibacillus ishigakijimensis]|uniref:Thioredoxin family protein n=1 Tax=Roseibacillus ishigakijimensis TaxID=454146 RepID=A0A934RRI5_9BACT|nr:thioredoxin family protein [Roseibacillus ishigakijimensis]MBK1832935.1 thioredoxin family protein [Roseibacillus ishigakijimensis]
MKSKTLAVAFLGIFAASASAELTWHTDFEKGQKAAEEAGKNLLVDFTGSDWCHWCIKLKEEVFDQEAFEAVAEDYVLVELDFPNDESLVSPEQRKKNEELALNYSVEGFPTVLLFDSAGRPIARTGYQQGGAEAYLKHLAEITQPYENLKKADGEEREEALATFLSNTNPSDIEAHFEKELDELKKLDPEDERGVQAELASAKRLAEFQSKIEEKFMAGEFDKALADVDSYLAKHEPKGEELQFILMARLTVYVEQGKKEEAFAAVDEVAKVLPESDFAQNVEVIKNNITAHLQQRAEMEEESPEQEEADSE